MQAEVGKKAREQRESERSVRSVAWMLYSTPPGEAEEVRLDELEHWALARLHVLKQLEWDSAKGMSHPELCRNARNKCKELGLPSFDTPSHPSDEIRKDRISHFVLRLAFCRSEKLRRWLLWTERSLFVARFESLLSRHKAELLNQCDLPCHPLAQSSVHAREHHLRALLMIVDAAHYSGDAAARVYEDGAFYSVPFEHVPHLVSRHRCLLEGGDAIVHQSDISSLVAGEFRNKLSEALIRTLRRWQEFSREEDGRMKPIVESLSERYIGSEPGNEEGGITERLTSADIPSVSQQSFPLCMKRLVEQLNERDHLRHGGRMQLGLFLKGIGLPLEESLAFWRHHFTKRGRMNVERWEKEHAYNVRHNYGLEGSRIDYTPYSCNKIISAKAEQNDFHGCPYVNLDEQQLRGMLSSLSLKDEQMSEVLQRAKLDPKVACTRTLAYAHNRDVQSVSPVEHPKEYFFESRRFRREQLGRAEPEEANGAE